MGGWHGVGACYDVSYSYFHFGFEFWSLTVIVIDCVCVGGAQADRLCGSAAVWRIFLRHHCTLLSLKFRRREDGVVCLSSTTRRGGGCGGGVCRIGVVLLSRCIVQ